MTVADLMAALQTCDPEKRVIFRTTEADYGLAPAPFPMEGIRRGDINPYELLTRDEADTLEVCVILESDEIAE